MVVEQLNELSGRLEWGRPKTAAGRRAVSIPATLADLLAEQLARPVVARSGLAFPSPLGEPLRRSNFGRRVWSPATAALGLDGLRFHDLRHTAVAMAISQGAHPKAIQERMGHSSVTVTLDRYGHLYEGLDGHLAEGLDDVLRHLHTTGPRTTSARRAGGLAVESYDRCGVARPGCPNRGRLGPPATTTKALEMSQGDSRGLLAASAPPDGLEAPHREAKAQVGGSGASWNRTSDLILIRDAL